MVSCDDGSHLHSAAIQWNSDRIYNVKLWLAGLKCIRSESSCSQPRTKWRTCKKWVFSWVISWSQSNISITKMSLNSPSLESEPPQPPPTLDSVLGKLGNPGKYQVNNNNIFIIGDWWQDCFRLSWCFSWQQTIYLWWSIIFSWLSTLQKSLSTAR